MFQRTLFSLLLIASFASASGFAGGESDGKPGKGQSSAASGSGVGVIGDQKPDRVVRDRQVFTRRDGAKVRIRTTTKLLKSGGIAEKQVFRIHSENGFRRGVSHLLRNEKGQIIEMRRSKRWVYSTGREMEYSYTFQADSDGENGEYVLNYRGETIRLSHMYFIHLIVGEEFLD
ncbi:MAG: hypothetical protein JNL01_16995 [Bdellovibrionales bacterium]|nr:hypothetical protein [Bdellovibrionales bacterium]